MNVRPCSIRIKVTRSVPPSISCRLTMSDWTQRLAKVQATLPPRGVRGCQSPDNRRAEDRSDDIRQGSSGPNFRAGVEHQPRKDSMVSPALSEQWQDLTQEDGALHQAEDRRAGVGEQPRDQSRESDDAQKPCCSESDDQLSQSQGTSGIRHGTDRIRTSSGRAVDAVGGCQHAEPPRANPHALGPNASAGSGQHRSVPNDTNRGGVERSLEPTIQDAMQCDLALTAGEIDTFCESIPNEERNHVIRLVSMIEKELDTAIQQQHVMDQKIDVLEVLCSDRSRLTHQALMLGGKALRFGLDQGDLHQSEGRAKLFRLLCKHRPEHVWMSPVCKPWSKWSQLNSQRSLEMWDKIHEDRKQMLVQVALCFVLCRHQVRNARHAH